MDAGKGKGEARGFRAIKLAILLEETKEGGEEVYG